MAQKIVLPDGSASSLNRLSRGIQIEHSIEVAMPGFVRSITRKYEDIEFTHGMNSYQRFKLAYEAQANPALLQPGDSQKAWSKRVWERAKRDWDLEGLRARLPPATFADEAPGMYNWVANYMGDTYSMPVALLLRPDWLDGPIVIQTRPDLQLPGANRRYCFPGLRPNSVSRMLLRDPHSVTTSGYDVHPSRGANLQREARSHFEAPDFRDYYTLYSSTNPCIVKGTGGLTENEQFEKVYVPAHKAYREHLEAWVEEALKLFDSRFTPSRTYSRKIPEYRMLHRQSEWLGRNYPTYKTLSANNPAEWPFDPPAGCSGMSTTCKDPDCPFKIQARLDKLESKAYPGISQLVRAANRKNVPSKGK